MGQQPNTWSPPFSPHSNQAVLLNVGLQHRQQKHLLDLLEMHILEPHPIPAESWKRGSAIVSEYLPGGCDTC